VLATRDVRESDVSDVTDWDAMIGWAVIRVRREPDKVTTGNAKPLI
jgi:hypothetical protein